MKCQMCGGEIPNGAKFCSLCGSQQAEPVAQEVSAYEQQYEQAQADYSRQSGYVGEQQGDGGVSQGYVQPGTAKKSKKPLIIIIAAAAVVVITAVVLIFVLKGCGSYDRSTPRASVQAMVNAINNNNSREIYQSASPSARNLALSQMPYGYKGLLMNGNYEIEDEIFHAMDEILKLAHKKFDCQIAYNVKAEGRDAMGNTTLTGDLYFGNINVGELEVSLIQDSGSWYILNFDTSRLDTGRLERIFNKYDVSGRSSYGGY